MRVKPLPYVGNVRIADVLMVETLLPPPAARDRRCARSSLHRAYQTGPTPWEKGGRYFFAKNDGLQNQSVYYWTTELTTDLAAEPKLLLDPNTLSEDGTTAVGGFTVSDDGKLVVYALSDAGSDWKRWRVRQRFQTSKAGERARWIRIDSGPKRRGCVDRA